MLEHSLLADFDKGEQEFGLASIQVWDQEPKVQLNLTVHVADFVLVHFNRAVQLVNVLWNDLGRSPDDE